MAEIIPIEPGQVMLPRENKTVLLIKNNHPFYLNQFIQMKIHVLCAILLLSANGLSAQNVLPQKVSDSLPLISLEEVQLIGIRANSQTPVTFTNITQKELTPRNLGQDIPILLNYLPAVVTTSDAGAGIGYTGIRVRGTDATRVNVTINGIPYNDAESQGTFWVNLPDFASSVGQIQLQRGVGTSTNGSAAFGASLNLETANLVDQPFVEIASSIGSFNSNKNTVQFSTGILFRCKSFLQLQLAQQPAGHEFQINQKLLLYHFCILYQPDRFRDVLP